MFTDGTSATAAGGALSSYFLYPTHCQHPFLSAPLALDPLETATQVAIHCRLEYRANSSANSPLFHNNNNNNNNNNNGELKEEDSNCLEKFVICPPTISIRELILRTLMQFDAPLEDALLVKAYLQIHGWRAAIPVHYLTDDISRTTVARIIEMSSRTTFMAVVEIDPQSLPSVESIENFLRQSTRNNASVTQVLANLHAMNFPLPEGLLRELLRHSSGPSTPGTVKTEPFSLQALSSSSSPTPHVSLFQRRQYLEWIKTLTTRLSNVVVPNHITTPLLISNTTAVSTPGEPPLLSSSAGQSITGQSIASLLTPHNKARTSWSLPVTAALANSHSSTGTTKNHFSIFPLGVSGTKELPGNLLGTAGNPLSALYQPPQTATGGVNLVSTWPNGFAEVMKLFSTKCTNNGEASLSHHLTSNSNRPPSPSKTAVPMKPVVAASPSASQQSQYSADALLVARKSTKSNSPGAPAQPLSSTPGNVKSGNSQKLRVRRRTSFDANTEVPYLLQRYAENSHPDRETIQVFVEVLNQGVYRQTNRKLDIQNVICWFKNHRACTKKRQKLTGQSQFEVFSEGEDTLIEHDEDSSESLMNGNRQISTSDMNPLDKQDEGVDSVNVNVEMDEEEVEEECDEEAFSLKESTAGTQVSEGKPRNDSVSSHSEASSLEDAHSVNFPTSTLNNIPINSSSGNGELGLDVAAAGSVSLPSFAVRNDSADPQHLVMSSMADSTASFNFLKRMHMWLEPNALSRILTETAQNQSLLATSRLMLATSTLRAASENSVHGSKNVEKLAYDPDAFYPDAGFASQAGNKMLVNFSKSLSPVPPEAVSKSGSPTPLSIVTSAAQQSLASNGKLRRSRCFIDPASEIPQLEQWFQECQHPSQDELEHFCKTLNCGAYRQQQDRLEVRNIQLWFKNRRAKLRKRTFSTMWRESEDGGASGSNIDVPYNLSQKDGSSSSTQPPMGQLEEVPEPATMDVESYFIGDHATSSAAT